MAELSKVDEVIDMLISNLHDSGIVAYDTEPPEDTPSPWVLLMNPAMRTFDNESAFTLHLTVRTVTSDRVTINKAEELAKNVNRAMLGMFQPFEGDATLVKTEKYPANSWNVVDQRYKIIVSS